MNNIQKALNVQNIVVAWAGPEPLLSSNITLPYLEEKIVNDKYPRMTRSADDTGAEIDIAKLRIDYDVFVSASTETTRVKEIKQLASNVIISEYPEWKQRNITARMVELINKRATTTLTAEESAELITVQAIWDWIKDVRALSDQAEIDGLMPVEITWPDVI